MSAFSFISIGYLLLDLLSLTIEKVAKPVALKAATRKVFRIKEFANTLSFYIYLSMF